MKHIDDISHARAGVARALVVLIALMVAFPILTFDFKDADVHEDAHALGGETAGANVRAGHNPIVIVDDTGFTQPTVVSGVVNPGAAGSKLDPYIIEGWDINCAGVGTGIIIQDTTKFFIIRNCRVANGIDFGIRLSKLSNGAVRECEVSYFRYGIYLNYTNSSLVMNNYVHDCNSYSITLAYCNQGDITVWGNTISPSRFGISIAFSRYARFAYNNMTGCGVFLNGNANYDFYDHDIQSNNLVNGKPVYYLKNATSGAVPTGYGQVILASCSNIVIEGKPYQDISIGITLAFCSNIFVGNTSVTNCYYGIYMVNSNGCTFYNATVTGGYYGFYIVDSVGNTFVYCNVTDFISNGMFIGSGSNDNIVRFCRMKTLYDRYLIYLSTGTTGNLVYQNKFVRNPGTLMFAYDGSTLNNWNYTGIGNYWSNKTAPDVDCDGFVEDVYRIGGTGGRIDYHPLSYVVREPIVINNDMEFTAENGVSNPGPFAGTLENPYIIEGFGINASGHGFAIFIGNTSKFVIVKDCMLHHADTVTSPVLGYCEGLALYNAWNAYVVNCTIFSNLDHDIFVYGGGADSIVNNTVYSAYRGICTYNAQNVTVFGNEIFDIALTGIFSTWGENISIMNNTVSYAPYGYDGRNGHNILVQGNEMFNVSDNCIYLDSITNVIFENNNFYNSSGHAVDLYNVGYCTFGDNYVHNSAQSGIFMSTITNSTFTHNMFCNNTYSGVYAYETYNVSIDNNTFEDNGKAADIYYSTSFSFNDNTAEGSSDGGYLSSCTNVQFSHNIFRNVSEMFTIYIYNVSHFEMAGNIIENTTAYPLDVLFSSMGHITNNVFDAIGYYCFFEGGNNVSISNNVVNGSKSIGFYIRDIVNYSVFENVITNTTGDGIYCYNVSNSNFARNFLNISAGSNYNAIQMQRSSNNTIIANRLGPGYGFGLYILSNSNYNTIAYNRFCNPAFCMILASDNNTAIKNNFFGPTSCFVRLIGNNNRLYYNNFFKAPGDYSPAFDQWSGYTNYFDNNTEGNFYIEWDEPDADLDGIVDNEYILVSTTGLVDHRPLTYAYHDPIRINCDSDFMTVDGVANPLASGTISDPYIIENWYINGTGIGNCIFVGNTTKYFVIRNCTLVGASGNNGLLYRNSGVLLYNAMNGTVESVLSINHAGIGIALYNYVKNTVVRNCIVHDCALYGIYISGPSPYNASVNVTNNTIWNCDSGIYCTGVRFLYINNNTIRPQTTIGIYLASVQYSVVQYNIVDNATERAFYVLGGSSFVSIEHNMVINGTTSAWQYGVYITGCNNITTQNNTFRYPYPMYAFGNQRLTFVGNVVQNAIYGLYLFNSHNSSVYENSFQSCNIGALINDLMDDTHISRNSFNHCDQGIYDIGDDRLLIDGNSFYACSIGLYLAATADSDITNNSISVCGQGFDLHALNGNRLLRNRINAASSLGIQMENSDGNTIAMNTIENCTSFGLMLKSGCDNNTIYYNNFINNNNGAFQQADVDSDTNYWSFYKEGNYWSVDGMYDENFDGIFDAAVAIKLIMPGVLVADGYPLTHRWRDVIRIDNDNFTAENGVINPGALGTSEDPFIIENWYINASGLGCGIYLGNTTKHFVIRNCTSTRASGMGGDMYYFNSGLMLYGLENARVLNFTSYMNFYGVLLFNAAHSTVEGFGSNSTMYPIFSQYGDFNRISNFTALGGFYSVWLYYVNDMALENGVIQNPTSSGVVLQYSHGCAIANYSITDCPDYCIFVGDSDNIMVSNCSGDRVLSPLTSVGLYIVHANNVTAKDCKFANATNGLMLTNLANDNIIDNCIFTGNQYGIYMDGAERNVISRNNISNNVDGIEILEANNNAFYKNVISYNSIYGIHASNTLGPNQIDHNIFNSNGNLPQAYDENSMNNWNTSTMGNYWSHWLTPDLVEPYYIVDVPCPIGHVTGNAVDYYPLTYDPTINIPPLAVIDYVSPFTQEFGMNISFAGHGVDLDGTIAAYNWTSNVSGVISTAQSFNISTLPHGEHYITLAVMDDMGAWSTPIGVIITVTNAKPIAFINSVAPNPAVHYSPVSFSGSGTDIDGYIVNYTWYSDIDGILSHDGNFSTSALSIGTHSISLSVCDNSGNWAIPTSITLVVQQSPPSAYIAAYPSSPAVHFAICSFSGSASDPEGDALSYQWSSNIDGILSTSISFSTSSLSVGTHNITFAVSDGTETVYDYCEVVVIQAPPTAVITAYPSSPVLHYQSASFAGSGSDVDGSITAYNWTSSIDGFLSGTASFSTSLLSVGTHNITFAVMDDNGSWSQVAYCIVTVVQAPPSASIVSITPSPADQYTIINFTGTGNDADGTIVAYEWTSSIDGTLSVQSTFETASLSVGTHNITFRVMDDNGTWSVPVYATLMINPVNLPPSAAINSVIPTCAVYGSAITFNGTGSDPDGEITAYNWTSSIDGFLNGSANFTIAWLSIGTHTIYFSVMDDNDTWSSVVTSTVVIIPPNHLPTASITSITPNPAIEGQTITFVGLGSDADGTIVGYNWTSDIDGYLGNASTLALSSLSVGNHTITLRVLDDNGSWSANATAILIVNDYIPGTNVPPTAQIVSITPNPTEEGAPVAFTGLGTDADGIITAYNWTSSIDGFLNDSATFTTSALSVGIHNITFTVMDNNNSWSAPAFIILTINAQNVPPSAHITFVFPTEVQEGEEVSFTGTGLDSDGSIAAYNWTSDIDGFLDGNASFSTTSLSVGTHNITFAVQDDDGAWSAVQSVIVIVNPYAGPNVKPTASITSISPSPGNEGEIITFIGTGIDEDGTIIAYRWVSSIDGELNGSATFSTSALSIGTHTIYFYVQDNNNSWSNASVATLVVVSVNIPPNASIVSAPSEAFQGDVVSLVGTGSDADGSIAAYNWTSSIQGFLGGSSVLNLTNLTIGTHAIFLTVCDNDGAWSAVAQTTISISARPTANARPNASISSITPNPTTFGTAVTFTGTGTDPDGTIVAYNWTSSIQGFLGNASTLVLNNLTTGNHTIRLSVMDNNGTWSAEVTFALQVVAETTNNVPTASIISITPSPAKKGKEVTLTGTGTDEDGTIVAYEWTSSIDGTIGSEMTVVTSKLSVGTHTIWLRVKDNSGAWSATANATLVVKDTSVSSVDTPMAGTIGILLAIGVIAAICVIALLLFMRRKKPPVRTQNANVEENGGESQPSDATTRGGHAGQQRAVEGQASPPKQTPHVQQSQQVQQPQQGAPQNAAQQASQAQNARANDLASKEHDANAQSKPEERVGMQVNNVENAAETKGPTTAAPAVAAVVSAAGAQEKQNIEVRTTSMEIASAKGSGPKVIVKDDGPLLAQLFLVYHDGRLIDKYPREEGGLDADTVSSMLTAVQDFIKDSFQGQGSGINVIKYGKTLVVIERGVQMYLAAVVRGQEPPTLRTHMRKALIEVRNKYPWILKRRWSGELSEFEAAYGIMEKEIALKFSNNGEKKEDQAPSPSDEFKPVLERIKACEDELASLRSKGLDIESCEGRAKLAKAYMQSKNFGKADMFSKEALKELEKLRAKAALIK